MARSLKCLTFSLLLGAVVAAAEDRLAVLEFFGRQTCSICSSAGPTLTSLQFEMRGRAVLLEYDYDAFPYGRQNRFWATEPSARYLPLVMVGSGYRTSSGAVDFDQVYRSMIDDELARPVRAAVSAYWRRTDSVMRAYVSVLNLGESDIEIRREGAIWLIAYENSPLGHSTTWVRSTAQQFLPYDLEPGESTTLVVDSPPMSDVDWSRMAALALIEDRPRILGGYDMLQAAEALPVGLAATPAALECDRSESELEVVLTGPHVLEWSATSSAQWIDVTPSSGELPATVTLKLRHGPRTWSESEGSVIFSATGDDMDLETTVTVAVADPHPRRDLRRAGRIR